jgi:hypothetical protein
MGEQALYIRMARYADDLAAASTRATAAERAAEAGRRYSLGDRL